MSKQNSEAGFSVANKSSNKLIPQTNLCLKNPWLKQTFKQNYRSRWTFKRTCLKWTCNEPIGKGLFLILFYSAEQKNAEKVVHVTMEAKKLLEMIPIHTWRPASLSLSLSLFLPFHMTNWDKIWMYDKLKNPTVPIGLFGHIGSFDHRFYKDKFI